jgi:hypothetical protein
VGTTLKGRGYISCCITCARLPTRSCVVLALSLRGAITTKQSWSGVGKQRLPRFARNDRKEMIHNDSRGYYSMTLINQRVTYLSERVQVTRNSGLLRPVALEQALFRAGV